MPNVLPYLVFLPALALLLVPALFSFRASYPSSPARPRLRLDVAFLSGLFGISLSFFPASWRLCLLLLGRPLTFAPVWSGKKKDLPPPSSAGEKPQPHAPSAAKERDARPESSLWSRFGALSNQARPFAQPMLTFLRSVPGAFQLSKVDVNARFGLSDPARTGMLFGCLQGLDHLSGGRIRLYLSPDFTSPGIRGRIDLVVRIYLGYLLLLVFRLLFQAAFRWLALRLPRSGWRPGIP